MNLWRHHEAAETIAVPWREDIEQEDPLHQRDVVADGGATDLEWAREIGHVQQLSRLSGSKGKQPRQRVEGADPRQVPLVSLDERIDVVSVPGRSAAVARPGECSGISTGYDTSEKILSKAIMPSRREAALQEMVEESGLLAGKFALRQRMKPKDLHAPGEGIRKLGDEKSVCRPGENKASGHAITIHSGLKGHEHAGYTLHLVEDGSCWQVADEAYGVGLRRLGGHVVIETEVFIPVGLTVPLCQRGLAALPRPMDKYNRRVSQRFREQTFDESWVVGCRSHGG